MKTVAPILLFASLLSACAKEPQPAAPPPVQTPPAAAPKQLPGTAVRRADLAEVVQAIGSFRARRTSRVGPQVSGRLAEVLVDVGDAVRSGQELARVDRALFEIERDQAAAAVASAEARASALDPAIAAADADARAAESALADARTNFERMKLLWERPDGGTPSIPKSRYDDAAFRVDEAAAGAEAARSRAAESRARLAEARAGVAEAKERLRHTEQRLAETVVRAPFDGVVSARLADPGEPVTSAPVTHLLEIQETATLELEFALPQSWLASVRAGTGLTFDVEGVPDGAGAAAVEVVFPAIDEMTRSFRCRAVVANDGGRYRPGLLAQVRVTVRSAKGALVVPESALRRGTAGWQVATAPRGDLRDVVVGIVADGLAEIRSGLAEGDLVVAGGAR